MIILITRAVNKGHNPWHLFTRMDILLTSTKFLPLPSTKLTDPQEWWHLHYHDACISLTELSKSTGCQWNLPKDYGGQSLGKEQWTAAWLSGLGHWVWNLEVPGSNPPPCCYLDSLSVVSSATPRPCWVNSQLVSLPPVGILNSLCCIRNIQLLTVFRVSPISTTVHYSAKYIQQLNKILHYGSFLNFNLIVNILKITKGFSSSSRSSKAD